MTETPSESEAAAADTKTSGLGGILQAGLIFGIGFIILFDTISTLSALYGGTVFAPVEVWIRVIITSVVGSTCVLASLSIVLDLSSS